jgi:hypothetical protein
VTTSASKEFRISIVYPRSTNFVLDSRILQGFPEFLFYVIGIICTYTGICVLYFDPILLLNKIREFREIGKDRGKKLLKEKRQYNQRHNCDNCHQTMLLVIRQIRIEAETRKRIRINNMRDHP